MMSIHFQPTNDWSMDCIYIYSCHISKLYYCYGLVRTGMHFQVETHGVYQGLDVSETRLDPIYGGVGALVR